MTGFNGVMFVLFVALLGVNIGQDVTKLIRHPEEAGVLYRLQAILWPVILICICIRVGLAK